MSEIYNTSLSISYKINIKILITKGTGHEILCHIDCRKGHAKIAAVL